MIVCIKIKNKFNYVEQRTKNNKLHSGRILKGDERDEKTYQEGAHGQNDEKRGNDERVCSNGGKCGCGMGRIVQTREKVCLMQNHFSVLFFRVLIQPKSKNEDRARQEFILNIFLTASVVLLLAAFLFVVLKSTIHQGDSPLYVGIVFIFFAILFLMSRLGFSRVVAYIFVAIYFMAVVRGIYIFGIDQPQTLLGFALLIVIAGVLIGSRFAFLITMVSMLCILNLGYAQINSWYPIKSYWKREVAPAIEDPIMFSLTLSIIAIASWLSNREIEKSLTRARRSETELKKERDSLEVTVEARTRELKETQAEKMTQLYRFAEFGRLSSGLFHDLINPLTAVSLNIEKVKNAEEVRTHVKSIEEKTGAAPITEVSEYVDKAIIAAKKMEDMVNAVRKQLSRQETKTLFSVNEEIAQALEVLSHKAQKSGVTIRFFSRQEVKTYGDAVKFNQVALNLVANAIDSYQEKRDSDAWTVTMSLSQEGGMIIFEVKDRGVGIPEENKSKLFEPFFTTKKEGHGLGIGLSMIKRIIEKDFGGSTEVASKEGEGSVFTVKFPQKQNE